MSNIQYVFLKQSDIPSRDALQASVDRLGFDLQLDPELNLLEDEGFSEQTLEGRKEVGFELELGPAAPILDDAQHLREAVGGRDACLELSWHGRAGDLACAMIVSYALAHDYGAVVSYECDEPDTLDALLSGTQEALLDARKEA